jgi:hypothetical protein
MNKIMEFIDGKKTYIVATLVGVAAVLQYLQIDIPTYVWTVLGALGLGAVRSALKKEE